MLLLKMDTLKEYLDGNEGISNVLVLCCVVKIQKLIMDLLYQHFVSVFSIT